MMMIMYILVVSNGSVIFSMEAISDKGNRGPASEVVINTDAVSEISVFNAGVGSVVS